MTFAVENDITTAKSSDNGLKSASQHPEMFVSLDSIKSLSK